MRPLHTAALAMLLSLSCAPQGAPPQDPAADEQALRELAHREMAGLISGDLGVLDDTIGSVFAADVLLLPPNEPAFTGTDGVRAWAEHTLEMFDITGGYTSVESHVEGDVAWQVMRFDFTLTPKAGGDAITDSGRSVHVLRRQPDGSWKIVLDIWNSSMPLPGM